MDTIWTPDLPQGQGPKYKSVARSIRDAVADDVLRPGEKLPPVRDLAWRLGITPGTVARAYTVLTDEGVLVAEVGRGTFVAQARTALTDDVWSRIPEPPETALVSLFSPRLPDMGQVALIRAAMRTVANGPAETLLNYPTRDAYLPVREAAVTWLGDVHLGRFGPDDVVLAHGGQNAISLVFQAILRGPKPCILVEDLSYAGFRRAAETLRAEVQSVAIDEKGLVPEALDLAIRATGAAVLCTSPEVHNPTGICTPLDRRQAIAAVCRAHGVQILEDDCYRVGTPRAPSYRALLPELAWHVSSISKSLTPALRLGFAIAPPGRGPDLRRVAEYGFFGLAGPLAEVARIVLGDPETKVIAGRICARLGDYIETAVNTLGAFDLTWNREVPFVWLRLPAGWRAAAFCRAAEREGVQIRSADEFALRDGRAPHAVRIAVNGHVALKSFEAAMLRLRHLLDNPPEQISV